MGDAKYPAKRIEPQNGDKKDRYEDPSLSFIIGYKGKEEKQKA
jgi:hypothetical protein